MNVYIASVCNPNPGGKISYGALIKDREQIIYEISKTATLSSSLSTNNTAEYCALIASMKYLIANERHHKAIEFYSSSKLVVNQMAGNWKLKDGAYKGYALIAGDLRQWFESLAFEWVPKEDNKEAFKLAWKAQNA